MSVTGAEQSTRMLHRVATSLQSRSIHVRGNIRDRFKAETSHTHQQIDDNMSPGCIYPNGSTLTI